MRERNWLNNYRHAKAYAKRRGDLLVPASYVDETGFRLGVWISNLRAARKTRPDSFQVTPEHIGRPSGSAPSAGPGSTAPPTGI